MLKVLSLIVFLLGVQILSAQLLATVEVKEPIPGACSATKLYALFSGFKGQVEPKCPLSKAEIEAKLNSEVQIIKDAPKTKGKLMISCVVNCKGEMVQCKVDNKSSNAELDKQVLMIFKALQKWTPGTLDGKEVDCEELYSIEVKKGVIRLT